MGAKKINDYQLITNGSMTGTSTVTSDAQNIENFDNVGLQFTWTGTPVGTFSISGSIDGENFYPLTFDPVLEAPSGSAGGFLVNLNQVPYPFIQVAYTNASSTGTLNVFIFSKDLN